MIDPRNPDYQDTPAAPGRAVFGYRPASIPARPEVSVITPYYNVGPLFHETARCLLNQSLQDWEWIIVDDGSTDPAAIETLDRYRNMDPRIRVIDLPENRGTSAAKNEAYVRVRSDLIFQLDSDDLIEPTMLEKMAWCLRTNPEFGMVHSYTIGFGNEEYLWRRGFHGGTAILKENPIVPLVLMRKSVFEDVGGYQEDNREGLEDWEFWIAAADKGHWGATIPEFLSWYRRKAAHCDRWPNWDGGNRQTAFHQYLRKKYTNAFGGRFPKVQAKWHAPFEDALTESALSNPLARDNPRILMVLPWLRMGGADKWNLDLVKQLRSRGWGVSIVTTLRGEQTWLSEFARHTPDIFVMDRFVRDPDVPAFLRHMIESRRPSIVMVSNSWFGYDIIPFLRSVCPSPAYVDLSHIEEESWHNGGHPRRGVGMQDQLDLNIVISKHLKQWMVARGADPSRIEVSYCNVDHEYWTRNPEVRTDVRCELGIGTDESVILFAGRLCAQKQPNVLAKTLLRVAQSGKQFTAIIAGDGPDSPWLRSFVDEHKLASQVKLLGEVSSDRVRDLMSAADIYFLPSSWEGIALSFYEAMSMELAVVGAIVGGQLELVTPDCGILLPKADEDTEITAYADAIGSLMAEPARIKALGRTARDRIK
ncbi:MAG: glycosyltransferase, partial [Planctomycetes bacterium]|nr:glycosyltransferase [Planctomycetota bacterium]